MASSILRRIPLKVALVLTVVCLVVKEEFPFSHFPMYESFDEYSYIVYVADREGNPIPVQTLTSVKTSKLKKIFGDEQEEVRDSLEASGVKIDGFQFMTKEQRYPAGMKALQQLFELTKPSGVEALRAAAPLRLYYMHIRSGDDGIQREVELIAEMEAPKP